MDAMEVDATVAHRRESSTLKTTVCGLAYVSIPAKESRSNG